MTLARPEATSRRGPGSAATSLCAPEDPLAQIGPLCRLLGQLAIAANVVFGLDVLQLAPSYWTLAVLPAAGCVMLAPGSCLARLRVSLPVLLLLGWMTMSVAWSADMALTIFAVRVSVPPLLGLVAVTGLLARDDIAQALVWTFRGVLLLQAFELLTNPSSRVRGSDDSLAWSGTFISKNGFASFVAVAGAVLLAVDRGRWRIGGLAVVAVFLIGSDSWTGRAAALVAVAVWLLATLARRRREDAAARALLVLTVVVAAGAVVSLVFAFNSVINATGRDTTLTGRTEVWASSVEVIEQRPLTGYGLNAFINSAQPTGPTREIWADLIFDAPHAHNGVLDAAGKIGLVGVGLVAAIVAVTIRSAVRHMRAAPASATAILSLLGVYLTSSIAEPYMIGSGWTVFLVLGRGWSLQLREPGASTPGDRPAAARTPAGAWA